MSEEKNGTTVNPPEATQEADFLDSLSVEDLDFNSEQYDEFLSSIFQYGKIPSKVFNLSDNFKIRLEVLSPAQTLEVTKKIDGLPGALSKEKTLILETLSRAIVSINSHPLRFSDTMIEEWQVFRGTKSEPTTIEQQRFILTYRFQQSVLELIYSKYRELVKEQAEVIINLKKNSENS